VRHGSSPWPARAPAQASGARRWTQPNPPAPLYSAAGRARVHAILCPAGREDPRSCCQVDTRGSLVSVVVSPCRTHAWEHRCSACGLPQDAQAPLRGLQPQHPAPAPVLALAPVRGSQPRHPAQATALSTPWGAPLPSTRPPQANNTGEHAGRASPGTDTAYRPSLLTCSRCKHGPTVHEHRCLASASLRQRIGAGARHPVAARALSSCRPTPHTGSARH
jgi:hypothetical protein